MSQFNLRQLLVDVFDPQKDDRVVIMIDLPHDNIKDNEFWADRRRMAEEWRNEFVSLSKKRGFKVFKMLTYAATGMGGAELPKTGNLGDKEVLLSDLFKEATLLVALNEFSATAPLSGFAEHLPRFRAASMPGVTKSMERTGFAADYKKIRERCRFLLKELQGSSGIYVEFSTGHKCFFDLRFARPSVDDGCITQEIFGRKGDSVPNFPGGETFVVPYEGYKEGIPSKTNGELPVNIEGNEIIFVVKGNRIQEVAGKSAEAGKWRKFIEKDTMRRNIAEVAFGCNDMADPFGPVIESEKSGFHWALGASDHLWGHIGDADFDSVENVCHHDFVYSGKNSVVVNKASIIRNDGSEIVVMKAGKYVI